MPKAYSQSDLIKTYEEIALERKHVCSGCGGSMRLSHSHLIPKSRRPGLATVKENIVYHCISLGETIGCHSKYEGMLCGTLNDFEDNFRIIYGLDREYFWLRLIKLRDYYKAIVEKTMADELVVFKDAFNGLSLPKLLERVDKVYEKFEALENINA